MSSFSSNARLLFSDIGNFIKILLFSLAFSCITYACGIIPFGLGVVLVVLLSIVVGYMEIYLISRIVENQPITFSTIDYSFKEASRLFSDVGIIYFWYLVKLILAVFFWVVLVVILMFFIIANSSVLLALLLFLSTILLIWYALKCQAKYTSDIVGLIFGDRQSLFTGEVNCSKKAWWLLVPLIGEYVYVLGVYQEAKKYYNKISGEI